MKRQLRIGFCLLGCSALALVNFAHAQQATTTTAPAARPALKFGADYQLAAWLAADAHVELSAAQLAEQKSASDEVRELARAEATRQAQIINALRPFLGDEALEPPLPPAEAAKAKAAEGAVTPVAQTAVAQTAVAPADAAQPTPPVVSTAAGPAFTLVSLKRSLADRAGTTLLGDLNKASGEAFDRRYRDHLAVAQLRQTDTLQTFREHASPALQAVIDSLLPR